MKWLAPAAFGTFGALMLGGLVLYVVLADRKNRRVAAEKKQRDNSLMALAQQQGWQYIARDTQDLPYRFNGEPFDRSSVIPDARFGIHTSFSAANIMVGSYRGYQMAAFDFRCIKTSGHGQDATQSVTEHSVVVLGTPRPRPTLQIQREGLVNARDLQLESVEFNNEFEIAAENDRFAYDVLDPRMMEWMLADQRTKVLPFRFEGDNLVVWLPGLLDVEWAMDMLDYACDILDRVPAHVWND